MPWIMPRRDDRSPTTLPMKSSGVSTSTAIIGSSSTGLAWRMPSLNAIDAAILNAFSFESTSCERAVEQRDLDVDDREAGEHAVRQRFAQALLDRGDELARHGAALDRVDELEALARIAAPS